jgi:hypothetical protein
MLVILKITRIGNKKHNNYVWVLSRSIAQMRSLRESSYVGAHKRRSCKNSSITIPYHPLPTPVYKSELGVLSDIGHPFSLARVCNNCSSEQRLINTKRYLPQIRMLHADDRACDPARQYEGYSMGQSIIRLGKTPSWGDVRTLSIIGQRSQVSADMV